MQHASGPSREKFLAMPLFILRDVHVHRNSTDVILSDTECAVIGRDHGELGRAL